MTALLPSMSIGGWLGVHELPWPYEVPGAHHYHQWKKWLGLKINWKGSLECQVLRPCCGVHLLLKRWQSAQVLLIDLLCVTLRVSVSTSNTSHVLMTIMNIGAHGIKQSVDYGSVWSARYQNALCFIICCTFGKIVNKEKIPKQLTNMKPNMKLCITGCVNLICKDWRVVCICVCLIQPGLNYNQVWIDKTITQTAKR